MDLDIGELWTVLQPRIVEWSLKAVGALVVLLIGLWVASLVHRAARRGVERSSIDDTLAPFLGRIAHLAVLVMVAIAVLSALEIPMGGAIAIVGAAGLAIALAFQGTLSNFAAGVALLTFRPFRVGDFVEVGGVAGTVKELGLFSSTLATPDNVRIVVPNSKIYGETMKNFSANDTRRIDLVVGVGYDDDLGVAADTMLRVIGADPRVLAEPEPVVKVSEMGDSSVNFVVRPWVATSDYWMTRFDLTRALKEELEAAGCSIPYPQRDVHLFAEGGAATTAPPVPGAA